VEIWMPLVSGGLTAGFGWLLAPGEPAPPALGAGPTSALPWSSERVLERRRKRREASLRGASLTVAGKRLLLALGAACLAELLDPSRVIRFASLILPGLSWRRMVRDEEERRQLPGLARTLAEALERGVPFTEMLDRARAEARGTLAGFLEAARALRQVGHPDEVAFAQAGTRLMSQEGRMLSRVLGHAQTSREARANALRSLSELTRQRTEITRRARRLECILALSAASMAVAGTWTWPHPWSWVALILGGGITVLGRGGPDA
jgi:Flp pilus assembly protein TadB